mmetsp:Transcript_648/g.1185  ORF Transcript_648/g.1185 Transcript_648/m.1185 type:complete len:177 (+) Transcript_648:96-626(+)
MSTTASSLDLANEHYAKEFCGVDLSSANAPSLEDVELYTAAMLVCAAADGVLDEKEEAWIVGHQAAFGAPDTIVGNIEELKTKWTYEEILEAFKASSTLKFTRRVLVYHCISACGADGVLDPAEVEAISKVATALDLPSAQFDELLDLYNQYKELNDKIKTCFWKESNPYDEEKKE